MSGEIAVVDYGMGNIHSIVKALKLYHTNTVFTSDHGRLRDAKALVLPGDGAFSAAMSHMNNGLGDILRSHAAHGRPLFGVCIGFQILFQDSDESASGQSEKKIEPGLGLLPGSIRRFQFADKNLRIPHMGWNTLKNTNGRIAGCENEYMYFIHSYRPVSVPAENVRAYCDYGGDVFPAAVEKEGTFAVQFHPEKSDRAGLKLIEDWVKSL